jgi:hypothetical protein
VAAPAASRAFPVPVPLLAGGAGFVFGAGLMALTSAVERSDLAFGPWAFYGNGAFAVPLIGYPLLLYVGWTALARGIGTQLALGIAVFGIALAIGFGLNSLFFAIAGLAVSAGSAGVFYAFRRGLLPLTPVGVTLALIAALPIFSLFFPPLGMALLAGAATAAGAHARSNTGAILIGAALLWLLAAGVLGIPLLFIGPVRT